MPGGGMAGLAGALFITIIVTLISLSISLIIWTIYDLLFGTLFFFFITKKLGWSKDIKAAFFSNAIMDISFIASIFGSAILIIIITFGQYNPILNPVYSVPISIFFYLISGLIFIPYFYKINLKKAIALLGSYFILKIVIISLFLLFHYFFNPDFNQLVTNYFAALV